MSSQATSDPFAGLDFRLIPLAGPESAFAERSAAYSNLPIFDLNSDDPLPELGDNPPPQTATVPLLSPTGGEKILRGESGLWMEGDVLMCACPDCGAPMSIRLWLMIADCWKCSTSIELTEEQEREAKRLIERRERQKRRGATARSASPAKPAVPKSPGRSGRAKPGSNGSARTSGASRKPAESQRGTTVAPAHRAPQRRRRRVAAARTLARRRLRRNRGPSAWLRRFFRTTPAWLVSLIFHLILLTLLALLTVPRDNEGNYITLNATVSKDLRRAGQERVPHPASEVVFDLPVPKHVDLKNELTRQAILRADQEARELRLVDTANPSLPDISRVKQQIGDPQSRRASLLARDPRVRVEVLEQEGGTTLTEAAVARGLRWLSQQQQRDGHWRLDGGTRSDSAGTSLALLPFLGAGQTHLTGRYKNEVAKGLRWLVEHQGKDGDLRIDSPGNTGMYAQGQGAIVLCEAFLMTGDERLREPAQKAIDFIVEAQYPDGGWRYKPNRECSRNERQSDTSVVGWQLMALQSARAAGLDVPDETFELASYYLDSVQHKDGAQYSYQKGRSPTHVMTAEALLCRIYMGWTKDNPPLLEGIKYLEQDHPPRAGDTNMYYWYYGTQTFHHFGGPYWDRWNLRMRDVLVNTQETRGANAGSWSPRGGHASAGGRVYMTSLAVCTLEVYYRHLPIFRQIDVD